MVEINLSELNVEEMGPTKSQTFKFELVTPIAMHGSDPKKGLEIRTQSINGMMRYWSRVLRVDAINQHRENVEGYVFGTANAPTPKKGVVSLRLAPQKQEFRKGKYQPSSTRSFAIDTFEPGGIIDISLHALTTSKDIKLNGQDVSVWNYMMSLTLLSFALGGFGQRGRHGLGSFDFSRRFKSKDEYLAFIKSLMDKLQLGTKLSENKIERLNDDIVDGAPYWKETVIIETQINNTRTILEQIKKATHDNDGKYSNVLGSAFPRVPSPLHTKVKKLRNGRYLILVSEVYNPNQAKRNYQESKEYYINRLKETLS